MFEPYARLFKNIDELEFLKLDNSLIDWDIKMEVELEKTELNRKEQRDRLIVECYLDEEVIVFGLDEEDYKDHTATNGYRMNDEIKNIIENMILEIEDRRIVNY